mgnify:CR=1 FL=1
MANHCQYRGKIVLVAMIACLAAGCDSKPPGGGGRSSSSSGTAKIEHIWPSQMVVGGYDLVWGPPTGAEYDVGALRCIW